MHHVQRHARGRRRRLRETARDILRHLIARSAHAVVAGLILVAACSSPGEDRASPASVVTPSATARTLGGWTVKADLPTPRTEVAVAHLEGRTIYVAGGFTDDGEATDVVEAYDVADDSWERTVSLPVPLHHAGLASALGRLYVVGGYTSDGRASGGVWSWAPGDRDWRAEDPLPTPRGALAVATLDVADSTVIHAVGGATGFAAGAELSDANEAFSLGRSEWLARAALPLPRDHLAAAATEGKVYVVGGRQLSLTTNQARLDVYDPLEDRWTRGPDMPTARGGLAAAAVDGRIAVVGGEQPRGTFPEVELFAARRNAWAAGPPLPTPRHGLGAAGIGNRLYVVGGGPTPGLSVSGANETLLVEE